LEAQAAQLAWVSPGLSIVHKLVSHKGWIGEVLVGRIFRQGCHKRAI